MVLAIGEAIWEYHENSPPVIKRFRSGGLYQEYYGDAIVNSVGDWVAAILGYAVCVYLLCNNRDDCSAAKAAKAAGSFFVLSEVVLILYQRDCLCLVWVQLLFNPKWLVLFQEAESMADRLLREAE